MVHLCVTAVFVSVCGSVLLSGVPDRWCVFLCAVTVSHSSIEPRGSVLILSTIAVRPKSIFFPQDRTGDGDLKGRNLGFLILKGRNLGFLI